MTGIPACFTRSSVQSRRRARQPMGKEHARRDDPDYRDKPRLIIKQVSFCNVAQIQHDLWCTPHWTPWRVHDLRRENAPATTPGAFSVARRLSRLEFNSSAASERHVDVDHVDHGD